MTSICSSLDAHMGVWLNFQDKTEENVNLSFTPWLLTWFMDHVVNPALALLDSKSSPLFFCHQVGGGHQFGQLLRKHNMPEDGNITNILLIAY